MMPYFLHSGHGGDVAAPCDCATMTEAEIDDENNLCHIFSLMISLVFFKTYDPVPILELLLWGIPSATEAFHASYSTSAFVKKSSTNTSAMYADPIWRRDAFDFCNT